MKFISRPEAYSYVIMLLNNLMKSATDSQAAVIRICINKVQILFEDHNKNPLAIEVLIKSLIRDLRLLLPDAEKSEPKGLNQTNVEKTLKELLVDLNNSDYQQSVEAKFENPLGRYLESALAITLLLNPTPSMMLAVGRISEEIIKTFPDIRKARAIESEFLSSLSDPSLAINFGHIRHSVSLRDVEDILHENDPINLPRIMHIHFKFSHFAFREIPIRSTPNQLPVGKFSEIVENELGGLEKLLNSLILDRQFRAYFSDEKFSNSALFQAERGYRGRSEVHKPKMLIYHRLGLMLSNQEQYESGLPAASAGWVPDCKVQEPNLLSQYVLDAIENDAIYVAGPSSMTGMLLGQMELLANFETLELKKFYLSAVAAYIVSGGFHSFHEVLGPAEYILNLVPGYNVTPPVPGTLAEPPNFHIFFKQQCRLDPDFAIRYDQGWNGYNRFFKEEYLEPIPDEIKEAIISRINLYIKSTQTSIFSDPNIELARKLVVLVESDSSKILLLRYIAEAKENVSKVNSEPCLFCFRDVANMLDTYTQAPKSTKKHS